MPVCCLHHSGFLLSTHSRACGSIFDDASWFFGAPLAPAFDAFQSVQEQLRRCPERAGASSTMPVGSFGTLSHCDRRIQERAGASSTMPDGCSEHSKLLRWTHSRACRGISDDVSLLFRALLALAICTLQSVQEQRCKLAVWSTLSSCSRQIQGCAGPSPTMTICRLGFRLWGTRPRASGFGSWAVGIGFRA